MPEISYTSKFIRKSEKLPPKLKRQIIMAESKFKADMYDRSLKTHKLSGKLEKFYSFSVNYSYRILFSIEKDSSIVFIDIGDHSIYQ